MKSEFFISRLKKQNNLSSSISTMSIVQMSNVSASYDSKDLALKDVTLNTVSYTHLTLPTILLV